MIVSPLARLLLAILAAVLLLPVLCIPLSDRAVLEQTHQRTLRAWPAASGFASDPVKYFRKAREWLADRAFPIVEASIVKNRFLFYVLATSPQRRVTLGRNDFVFINGTSEDDLYVLFADSCVKAHSMPVVKALSDALPALAEFSRSRGILIDVVLFPTLASVYAEYLPRSVPDVYRRSCAERSGGHSPLLEIRHPDAVNVVYPLLEMNAARDVDGFFPKANWHPDGLSLKIARDAYLARIGVTARVEETLELGAGPSEILNSYGIRKSFPIYVVRNERVQANADRDADLKQRVAHLFKGSVVPSKVFDNEGAVVPESVLMISDSFGIRASVVFAGAFRHLIQVNTNDMQESRLVELIDSASRLVRIDRLIFVVNEGNSGRVVRWSNALAAGHGAGMPGGTADPAPASPDAARTGSGGR